jgi:hypothetical protein
VTQWDGTGHRDTTGPKARLFLQLAGSPSANLPANDERFQFVSRQAKAAGSKIHRFEARWLAVKIALRRPILLLLSLLPFSNVQTQQLIPELIFDCCSFYISISLPQQQRHPLLHPSHRLQAFATVTEAAERSALWRDGWPAVRCDHRFGPFRSRSAAKREN